MALSKHTAAGAQGKGDPSSWGSAGRDRRQQRRRRRCMGGEFDEQLQPRAPVPPPLPPFPASTIADSALCLWGFCVSFFSLQTNKVVTLFPPG